MNILLLDVDKTIVPYQPTAQLFKELFLSSGDSKYRFIAVIMINMLKYLWFVPGIVYLQRAWILTLFSLVDKAHFDNKINQISSSVSTHFNENFLAKFNTYISQSNLTMILSHCPEPLAIKLNEKLGFDGAFSLPVKNYFRPPKLIKNFSKTKTIFLLRKKYPNAQITYFADDLIDFMALKSSDQGILVNASPFSKWFCKRFSTNIHIWE